MSKILILTLLGFLTINIVGCSPANILASGGATTMVVAEGDRSLGTVVDDATIKINIASKFIKSENNLFININTTVLEGRVLLTGLVENQEIRIDAVRIVWETKGVKEVINEIEVGNKASLKEYSKDLWINTQVKALAARTLGLRAIAYNFETIKGKVYIAGVTSKPEHVDELLGAVKTIKGVTEIVNYVVIKE